MSTNPPICFHALKIIQKLVDIKNMCYFYIEPMGLIKEYVLW